MPVQCARGGAQRRARANNVSVSFEFSCCYSCYSRFVLTADATSFQTTLPNARGEERSNGRVRTT